MITELANQCQQICVALAGGICIGMVTGAAVTYQLVYQRLYDRVQRRIERRMKLHSVRPPFDGAAFVQHYERIADVPQRRSNG